MKKISFGFVVITVFLLKFGLCQTADNTISNMMSSMTNFANKTMSSMESMTSSKNTTQTFSSSTSNILLDAAKKLDITNLTSDEEFLGLLFQSVFNIIKDTKSEEGLFFTDLTVILPTIIEKFIQQLQTALLRLFFGGFLNAGATAADVGLKIATALETGKLSAASQGIETAKNIADKVASAIPSNPLTDEVKKIVNTSLDGANGAINAAKTLETEGSKAISNVLNNIKMVNSSTVPAVTAEISKAVETANLTAASQGIEDVKKIADTIAGSLPSNGVTDEVKKIVNSSIVPAVAAKIASAVETAKLPAASQGIEGAQKIADKIADSVPSNGFTDQVKKIVSTVVEDATGAAKALETAGSNAIGSVFNAFKFGK